MKTQIKFPLTLDNHLNPALGKKDNLLSQDDINYSSGKAADEFTDLGAPTSNGQVNSRRKANPRLRIL
jgi:hypothetical protein